MKLTIFVCLILCLHSTIASNQIFRDVAVSFAFKGYQRSDPFELSPAQAQHQRLMEINSALAHQVTPPTDSPVAALIENGEQLSSPPQPDDAKVMEELKIALAKQAEEEENKPAVALAETESHVRKGIIDSIGGVYSKVQGKLNKLSGKYNPSNAQIYEDCMACRMVWKQVEMDISNPRYVEDVQASFEHNCMDAQKSTIFYKACEDMYDDMYAMTDDYMSGQYTVAQMCQRAKMCVNPS